MEDLLESLQLLSQWELLPMISGDLKSSHLGAKLTDALRQARVRQKQDNFEGPAVFLGMDSPETPLDEIAAVFDPSSSATTANNNSLSTAILCPADDGGYGMLSVPPTIATERVFAKGIRWSRSLTAVSQLKALTDAGVAVRLGRLMYDIDEPDDVHALVRRLSLEQRSNQHEQVEQDDVLLRSSDVPGHERTSDCPCTQKVLRELGLMPASDITEA